MKVDLKSAKARKLVVFEPGCRSRRAQRGNPALGDPGAAGRGGRGGRGRGALAGVKGRNGQTYDGPARLGEPAGPSCGAAGIRPG